MPTRVGTYVILSSILITLALPSLAQQKSEPSKYDSWGVESGGLISRLFVGKTRKGMTNHIEDVFFEIRNVSTNPLAVLMYTNRVPNVSVAIEGVPGSYSPIKSELNTWVVVVLEPDETISIQLTECYHVARYVLKKGGVVDLFRPRDKLYQISAHIGRQENVLYKYGPKHIRRIKITEDKGRLFINDRAVWPNKVACWNGFLASNSIETYLY